MAKAINVLTKGVGESSITQSAWARRIVFYVLLVILWQVIAMTGIWPDYLFQGPIAVFNALVNGFLTGNFLQASLLSLQRLAIGYSLVGTDRPGNHFCSGDGGAFLHFTWSGCWS